MHNEGVVHRDIKPDNLVLCAAKGSLIKLADFGLSAECERGACIQGDCGSEFYVAPEMLLQKPYNHKIDMWSAGVTMFILLFNKMPFSADTI